MLHNLNVRQVCFGVEKPWQTFLFHHLNITLKAYTGFVTIVKSSISDACLNPRAF